MKRILILFCALAFLLCAGTAPGAGPDLFRVGVIDRDPNGTNMRDAPKGKVVYTIPLRPADEMERVLTVHEQSGDWFRVTTESDVPHSGWMHSSVLGLRGGSTEDGPCTLKRSPSYDAAEVVTPGNDPVLQLVGFTGRENDLWFQVRYTDSRGVKHDGWVPVQCQ